MSKKLFGICLVMAMIFAFVGCTDVNQAVIDEALEIQELRAQPQAIKFVFEVTNMNDGEEAFINGTFWGGDWPLGWAQESWGGIKDASKTAVPEVDGVAAFGSNWDVNLKASIGDELVYNFKTQCNTDWSNDETVRAPATDQNATLVVEKAGTFKVSINSSTWEVSITEVE